MENFVISEFLGIQQHKDGSLLPSGSAYDCRNVVTIDGNLSVAKGYTKYISVAIPSTERILRLIYGRGIAYPFYVVTAKYIYHFNGTSWDTIYTFATALTTRQVGYLQTIISGSDYIIVATGNQQMVKIKVSDSTVSLFGTGEYSFSGTVSSYNAGTLTVTLSDTLSSEAQRHAPLDGITINGVWMEVASATSSTVVLAEAPDTAPASPNPATIRGGGSTASCNYVQMYAGRLFATGDPSNPSRLYWSAVSGDGRTIEDWLSVEGSVDASGGYVEVGDSSGDPIVGMYALASEIFLKKRYSIYHLFGDTPAEFRVQRVETFSEFVSNSSLVVRYSAPYYLTKSGLKYYNGTGELPIDGGIRYITRFIDSIYSVEESKGVHADNVLYFTCKTKSTSTYDDAIIVYDIARQSYTLRDGFEIADLVQNDGIIYLVNGNRYVYLFNDGADYDGVAINAYWETQHTDLQSKSYMKKPEVLLFRGGSGNMHITLHSDDSLFSEERLMQDKNVKVVSIRTPCDYGVTIYLRLDNVNGSSFSIYGGIQLVFAKELKNV